MSSFLFSLQKFITKIDPTYYNSVRHALEDRFLRFLKCETDKHYDKGVEAGLKEAQQILVIEDKRSSVFVKDIDHSIYGPGRFLSNEGKERDFIAKVRIAVENGIISMPTDEQMGMIFSSAPATCVAAGAGSGKSTTLALRVVYMLSYLGVKEESISIISFTRDSCQDLRKKLRSLFSFFGVMIPVERSDRLVKTYHSLLLKINSFEKVTIFDFIGDVRNDESGLSTKLTAEQVSFLRDCYEALYRENQDFREVINKICRCNFQRSLGSIKNEGRLTAPIEVVSARDLNLVGDINNALVLKGVLDGVDGIELSPVKAIKVNGFPFYANGIIKSTGQYIYFGSKVVSGGLFGQDEKYGKITKTGAATVKKKIVAIYGDQTSVYIDTVSDLSNLKIYIESLSLDGAEKPEEIKVLLPEVKLIGEMVPKKIFILFYEYATFIESLSMEVPECLSGIESFKASNLLEQLFSKALLMFWPFFEKRATTHNIITFNRLFINLAQTEFADVPIEKVECMRHLLIDEFQDISPQIVDFIISGQKLLSMSENNNYVSIMAVGDDWQSIYGWRGSSPLFFIEFDKFFPIFKKDNMFNQITLSVNFRSHSAIVTDSNKVVRSIMRKTDKPATSYRPNQSDEYGVVFKSGFDFSNLNDARCEEFLSLLEVQFNYAKDYSGADHKVMVLARTSDVVRKLKDYCVSRLNWKNGEVVFLTCHKSKGLQSIVTIVCDESNVWEHNYMKNKIYSVAPHFINDNVTYSQVVSDEALRLAYVSLTRGIRRVYLLGGQNSFFANMFR